MKHLRLVGRAPEHAADVSLEVKLAVLMQFIEAVRTLYAAKETIPEETEGEGAA